MTDPDDGTLAKSGLAELLEKIQSSVLNGSPAVKLDELVSELRANDTQESTNFSFSYGHGATHSLRYDS